MVLEPIELPRSIGGGRLVLVVVVVDPDQPPKPPKGPKGPKGPLQDDAVEFPFVPGCPVETPGGRGGVAAFATDGNAVFALTCGHTFESGTAMFQNGDRVAALVANLLDASSPMDAALCELTPAGLDAANAAAGADTWFQNVHKPDGADQGKKTRVFPTHVGAGGSFVAKLVSASTCATIDNLKLCGLVALADCTDRGDSGTLLSIGGEYLGICRGSTGHHSCFTPVRDALLRLRTTFPGLRIWRPS